MRLSKPLLQLPICFDPDRLAAEVSALPESAWMPHPTGFVGNEAVPFVAPGGKLGDGFEGAMGPTEHLGRCPYIMDILAELDSVWGRSRLMALAPGAEVPVHIDIHYYWRTHVRLHIPVITNPGVLFTCNGETVNMKAGECWAFDSFSLHTVQNTGQERRVHLVLDTVGGEHLWDLVEAATEGSNPVLWNGESAVQRRPLAFEQINRPSVMSPWEIRRHIDYVLDHAPRTEQTDAVAKRLDRFVSGWHGAWSQFGTSDQGLPTYRELIKRIRGDLISWNAQEIVLQNEQALGATIDGLILRNAVSPVPGAY